MIKVELQFETQEELVKFFTGASALGAVVPTTEVVVNTPEVVKAEIEEKKAKRKGTLKAAETKPVEVVEAVVEQEEVEESIDRDAVLNEAREVIQKMIGAADKNQAGAIQAKIIGVISSNGGSGKMSTIADDGKLFNALAELKAYATSLADQEDSFV